MLARYLDIKIGKWSGNRMEIENAFECAKIVDISARFYHSGSGVATKSATIVSERGEAGCAIV